MRLIDADALMRDIEQYHLSNGKFQHWIELQPIVDAVPVVHGTWVNADDDYSVRACSVCGGTYRMPFDFDGRMYPHKYCPNCGARMDAK